MSFVDRSEREINFKVVYWGPALAGKTSNLEWLSRRYAERQGGKLVCFATQTARQLRVDFLLPNAPRVRDLDCRFHLYTVPGPIFFEVSRELVLRGVDALVIVIDSQVERMQANIEAKAKLEQLLQAKGRELSTLPHVLQYNKLDLPNVVPVQTLRAELNTYGAAEFEAVARTGQGVDETFRAIASATLARARAQG